MQVLLQNLRLIIATKGTRLPAIFLATYPRGQAPAQGPQTVFGSAGFFHKRRWVLTGLTHRMPAHILLLNFSSCERHEAASLVTCSDVWCGAKPPQTGSCLGEGRPMVLFFEAGYSHERWAFWPTKRKDSTAAVILVEKSPFLRVVAGPKQRPNL